MNFYILEKGTTPKTISSFLEESEKLNIKANVINIYNISSKQISNIKNSKTPYIIYSTVDIEEGFALEAELFTQQATTFYNKTSTIYTCRNKAFQYIKLSQNNNCIPKTVFNYNVNTLQETIDNLNGFPLVVKTHQGERGVGVIKIDSFEGLASTLDLLHENNIPHLIQEYIDMDYYVRSLFIGNKQIESIRYNIPKNDFRLTSFRELKAKTHKLPENVINQCKKSMQLLDVEFAGIDILVKDNKYFISEVNYPCIYLNTQQYTKKNITAEMLKYLIEKQKKATH